MPVIPTYDAPNLGLQPSEVGVDALQQAARRVGAFASQTGEDMAQLGARVGSSLRDAGTVAMQSIEHHETAAGAKNYADLFASLTADWTAAAKKADPNDAGAAARWREQVMEPALDKFANQGFITEGGQQFAQQHIAALRQHLVEKTSTDMSTLAAVAVHTNFEETKNRLASSVYNDPSSLEFALKTADSSLGAIISSSPTLTAGDAARVRSTALLEAREGIVKSAVVGMIEKNSNVDLTAIEQKYGEYLKPGEMDMFQRQMKAQQKANAYYDRQNIALQKQENDLKLHKDMTDWLNTNVTADPNNPGNILIKPDAMQKLLGIAHNNPDAPSAVSTIRTGIDWLEHQRAPKPTQTEPIRKQALVDGMFSADKPTTDIDIYKAEVDGDLSRADAASLLALNKALTEEPLKGPIWQDTMNAVKANMIVQIPGLAGHDTVGMNNYAKFAQTFIPAYLAASRDKTLAPNALDVNDPKSMISQAMAPFRRTAGQRIQDYTAALGGPSSAIEASPNTSLPPAAERKAGQSYPTAMGMMKWTGTGWVKP